MDAVDRIRAFGRFVRPSPIEHQFPRMSGHQRELKELYQPHPAIDVERRAVHPAIRHKEDDGCTGFIRRAESLQR